MTTSASRQALDSVIARWNKAATPYDAVALAACYTEDALFFGGLAELSAGRAEIEKYFFFYGDTLPWMKVRIIDEVYQQIGDDRLILQGFADFDFGLPDGRTTHNVLRATLGLKREADGVWRIFLHHFSARPTVPPIPR